MIRSNSTVVRLLLDRSALLEPSGGNQFRVRAFANATRMVDELDLDVGHMVEARTLATIDGVGKGVTELVGEFVRTGPPVIMRNSSRRCYSACSRCSTFQGLAQTR